MVHGQSLICGNLRNLWMDSGGGTWVPPRQMLIDLNMSRNWLADVRSRILIPIMATAMTNELASLRLNVSDEIAAFHAS